jgi:hypothetical protein
VQFRVFAVLPLQTVDDQNQFWPSCDPVGSESCSVSVPRRSIPLREALRYPEPEIRTAGQEEVMNYQKCKTTLVSITGFLFLGFGSIAAQASSTPADRPQQNYDRASEEQPERAATQVFVGLVTRVPANNTPPDQTFMIYDDMHRANFFLDDPEGAARFEGQRAKVDGVLENGDYAIHVNSIDLFRPLQYLRVGK